jgi:DNA-binding TFAR19-related protein (PDSD5 family)
MVDIEFERLKRKRLAELSRRMSAKTPEKAPEKPVAEINPWKIVESKLADRGKEVLDAARTQFPQDTDFVVRQISLLITSGKLNEPLTGELLYTLFRNLGLRVRLNTKIVYAEHGKVKSIADKMRE